MRIVHISTAKGWRGGEQQALYLAKGLKAQGICTLMIAQPGSPMVEKCKQAEIDVEEVACRAEFDIFAMFKVSKILKKFNADIVHAHDGHSVSIAAIAGRLAGVKRVCTRRVDFKLRGAWKYNWGMDRVICISQAIRNICAEAGVDKNKMPVVLSGIDLARVQDVKCDIHALRTELGEAKKKRRIILNVASLTDHKGQCYLLEAMSEVLRKVPQALLVIAGDGELEESLKHQAKGLALDEDVVVFAGFRSDVPELLAACDVFVVSSHLEGLCTSIMDAMAAGKPVVATRTGGIPEIVEDKVTGLLAEPRDPESLADALVKVLSERKLRQKYAKNSQRVANQGFSFTHMVEGTVKAYQELLGASTT